VTLVSDAIGILTLRFFHAEREGFGGWWDCSPAMPSMPGGKNLSAIGLPAARDE
jgi:hypothetical protein